MKVIECWISISKYLLYQYGVMQVNPSVTVHLCNSNKHNYDSNIILLRQCTIHWQSKFQISVKSTKANNNYGSFCKVTPEHFTFKSSCLTLSTKTWNWSVLGWPHKSCCSYCSFW